MADEKKTQERDGFSQFCVSIFTLLIVGAYAYGALWLIEGHNLLMQTLGVVALIIAVLILQTAVLSQAVSK